MRALVVRSLLSAASAFVAPAPRMARGRAMRMAFESEAGVTAPLGYWVSDMCICM